MASPNQIRAGQAAVEIVGDSAPVEKELDNVVAKMRDVSKAIGRADLTGSVSVDPRALDKVGDAADRQVARTKRAAGQINDAVKGIRPEVSVQVDGSNAEQALDRVSRKARGVAAAIGQLDIVAPSVDERVFGAVADKAVEDAKKTEAASKRIVKAAEAVQPLDLAPVASNQRARRRLGNIQPIEFADPAARRDDRFFDRIAGEAAAAQVSTSKATYAVQGDVTKAAVAIEQAVSKATAEIKRDIDSVGKGSSAAANFDRDVMAKLVAVAEKRKREVRQALGDLGQSATSVGTSLLAGGVGTAGAFTVTIRSAIDAQAVLKRFKAVFGEQGAAAEAFATKTEAATGRSANALRKSLAVYGGFFKGLGFGSEQARDLAQSVVGLTQDFSSFNGVSDQETLERFISAISGSAEVLDQFGVNIRQAAIDQELLATGVKATAATATEQQKVIARLGIIRKTLGAQGAIGDATRNKGQFGNQLESLKAQLSELSATIGNSLIPVVQPAVQQVGQIVKAMSEWASENRELVTTLGGVAGGLGLAAIAGGSTLIIVGKLIIGVVELGRALAALQAAGAIAAIFNPGTLALLAFVAAAGAVAVVLSNTGAAVDGFSGKVAKQSASLRDAQAVLKGQIDRLKELSGISERTNAQTREAQAIIAALTKKYGDLGLRVGAATGKFVGLSEAIAKIGEAERTRSIADISTQIRVLQDRIREAKKNIDDFVAAGESRVYGSLAFEFGGTEGIVNNGKAIQDYIGQIGALKKRIQDLKQGGDPLANVTATKPGADPAALAKIEADAKEAAETLEKFKEAARDASDLNLDDADREIGALQTKARELREAFQKSTDGIDVSTSAGAEQFQQLEAEYLKAKQSIENKITKITADAENKRAKDAMDKANEVAKFGIQAQEQAARALGKGKLADDLAAQLKAIDFTSQIEALGIVDPASIDSLAQAYAIGNAGLETAAANLRVQFAAIEDINLTVGRSIQSRIAAEIGANASKDRQVEIARLSQRIFDLIKERLPKIAVGALPK